MIQRFSSLPLLSSEDIPQTSGGINCIRLGSESIIDSVGRSYLHPHDRCCPHKRADNSNEVPESPTYVSWQEDEDYLTSNPRAGKYVTRSKSISDDHCANPQPIFIFNQQNTIHSVAVPDACHAEVYQSADWHANEDIHPKGNNCHTPLHTMFPFSSFSSSLLNSANNNFYSARVNSEDPLYYKLTHVLSTLVDNRVIANTIVRTQRCLSK